MNLPAHHRGFSLLELIVVIAIIGMLAAIAVPAIGHFKRADATLAATRQMLDDVERARQLAISQRTMVYMVFCPSSFWSDPRFSYPASGLVTNLYARQLTAYAFVTLRRVGEQPGQTSPHYLSPWRSLPEGMMIPLWKFAPRSQITLIRDPATNRVFNVKGFSVTTSLPFPAEDARTPSVALPYLAFDYLGRLVPNEDEYLPLARGSVLYARNDTKAPIAAPPSVTEVPPGNSTNAFNLIHIDWLTGRARVEHQEMQ